jgi:type IV pilus assembly protein PilA
MLITLKKRLKNQRGLTLVELLAVIVILGIISAIAVPSIGKIISNTEKDAKVAEAKQIISAARLYVASEDPGDTTLTNLAALTDYLDNVKDDTFVVTIDESDSGKYIYTLSGHDAVTLVEQGTKDGSATEKEILDYK